MKKLTLLAAIALVSCRKEVKETVTIAKPQAAETATITPQPEEEIKVTERPDFITGDFDGDAQQDSVFIVTSVNGDRSGMKIAYATGRVDMLGMGKDVLGQGFDSFEWVGIFKKVQKGEEVAPNVDEDGEFYIEEIPDSLYTTLPHDGIFIHQAESCGGGIIYLDNGTYKWIQQE
jgi:hypothetical protein